MPIGNVPHLDPDKINTMFPQNAAGVEIQPSRGGWLHQQREKINIFRNYIQTAGFRNVLSYGDLKEKIVLAHQITRYDTEESRKGSFNGIMNILKSADPRTFNKLKEACAHPHLYRLLVFSPPAERERLLRNPNLMDMLLKLDKRSPDLLSSCDLENIEAHLPDLERLLEELEWLEGSPIPETSEQFQEIQALAKKLDPVIPKEFLLPVINKFAIPDPKSYIGNHIKNLLSGGPQSLNTSFLSTLETEDLSENLPVEKWFQCNFPSNLKNEDEIIDTNLAQFEIIITDPQTKEARQFSLSLPSPPCQGKMSAGEIKFILSILNQFYDGENLEKIRDTITSIYGRGQVDNIFNACEQFCSQSIIGASSALKSLHLGGYADPVSTLATPTFSRNDQVTQQVLDAMAMQSLFRLPPTQDQKDQFPFSLLPQNTNSALQRKVTITKPMIQNIADKIKNSEAKRPPVDLLVTTSTTAPLQLTTKREGELLEVTFSVSHNNKTYSHKVRYPLLPGMDEDQINETVNHLVRNDFLGRDILIAQGSFIKQIENDARQKAYDNLRSQVFRTLSKAQQRIALVEAMKLGHLDRGSLLPSDIDLPEAREWGTAVGLGLREIAERLEATSLETYSPNLKLLSHSQNKVRSIDVPITCVFKEENIAGEKCLRIDVTMNHRGRKYTYPLYYQYSPDQTRKDLVAELNSEQILEEDLLKAYSYFMRVV